MFELNQRITSFDSSPQFAPFTRVVVVRDEHTQYTAGDSSGRTLTIESPWGTQRIADGLLLQIRGFAYQPFEAAGALMSPAVELGDPLTVNGLEVFMYTQDITFGSAFVCTISSPDGEDIDHEYPYYPEQERKSSREISRVKSIQSTQYAELSDRLQVVEQLLQGVKRSTKSVPTAEGSSELLNYLEWEESADG